MAEYISRDELLKHLNECKNDPLFDPDMARICFAISIFVQNMKTADVQPVKHGRWIEKPPYKDETVEGLEFQIVCSECDEQNCSLEFDENYNAIGKTFYRTRYCPNCGARMDGEDNE